VNRKEVSQVTEKLEQYKERLNLLLEKRELSSESEELLVEMLAEMTELNRSNKALRRVILKSGQGSAMSTRLRDALYE
jgi:3-dehydroquinate dehydratase